MWLRQLCEQQHGDSAPLLCCTSVSVSRSPRSNVLRVPPHLADVVGCDGALRLSMRAVVAAVVGAACEATRPPPR